MSDKRDSLGRRVPEFDRSASGKKANRTAKEKHGEDFNARIGATGGRARKRGYFGALKDAGREDELKALAKAGSAKGEKYFHTLAQQDPEKLKAISAKGNTLKERKQSRRLQAGQGGTSK